MGSGRRRVGIAACMVVLIAGGVGVAVVSSRHPVTTATVPTHRASTEPGASESGEVEADLAEEEQEAAETADGRRAAIKTARAEGTYGRTGTIRHVSTPGWGRAQDWSPRNDDWEPALAADPREPWVYQATTRYYGSRACDSCPRIAIIVRASDDGGRTWGPDRFLCACPGTANQFDPQLEVAGDGTVYAAFLIGFHPGVSLVSSTDHGQTWSAPVNFPTNWSDKPVLAVSRDGGDIYLAFNGPTEGDIYVAQSHDGGQTFATEKVMDSDRYFFDGGAWVSTDGKDVVFAENDFNQTYTGHVGEDALVSHDRGRTWTTVKVDVTTRQPDCTSTGCYDGFYGTVPAIAGDSRGGLVFAYVGSHTPTGRQRMLTSRSTDGGLTWSHRQILSPVRANAVSPAAVGTGDGDMRVWWMDDRTGRFNVWYRRSADGGETWSRPLRVSNAISGVSYLNANGFPEIYGDYGEIAITNTGTTVATWGSAPSYYGPGGTWFNRQR
jgi:hypothetical protein